MKCCWLHQEYVLICCIRQYTYWIDPDMLEYLQPVWRMFHTRQHSAWMDADICVYNWWRYLCHHYHSATCLFVLEISHHALCSLVWFSCKWVVIMFCYYVITVRSELHKVLFLVAVCDFFVCLFMYDISLEPLNGCAPNSHGRRVWSLTWMSLNFKVKGQGHQGQIFSPLKMHCNVLTEDNVIQQQTGPFCCCWGGCWECTAQLHMVYVW